MKTRIDRFDNGSFRAALGSSSELCPNLARVVRFDFRAHGASEGTNEELRMSGLHLDAEAILAFVDAQFGHDTPMIPVGV